MSEFFYQPEQHDESAPLTPILDTLAPALAVPSEMVTADQVGVDTHNREAGRRAELNAVRAMVLRLAADAAEVMVLHEEGDIDDEAYEKVCKQFEEKIVLQFASVDMAAGNVIYDDAGDQVTPDQVASEALDAVYPSTVKRVLLKKRERLLDQLDQVNDRLNSYESRDETIAEPANTVIQPVTKVIASDEQMSEVLAVSSRIDTTYDAPTPVPAAQEFEGEIEFASSDELHTGLGRHLGRMGMRLVHTGKQLVHSR